MGARLAFMMRAFAAVLIVIGLTDACAQQPLRVISLPTQDSTMLWHFLEHTGGGYILSTMQPDQGAFGSTMIITDGQECQWTHCSSMTASCAWCAVPTATT
ncbi:MAG: hypothetical protein IPG92_19100 [Flavobacteriales bacterium]|nr:hypothetical protein [Flavobacteriales bacterium]